MNKAGLDAKTHLPGSKYRGIGWKWLVRWNGRAPGGYFDCAMLLALLCTVHVLILNICMFCDRIRLKGKLAKRQSIKIDGILKFNIIALLCLPPPYLILVSLALMVFCNLGFGIQPVFVFSFLVIYWLSLSSHLWPLNEFDLGVFQ